MLAGVGAGTDAGDGSGVLHALLPHGSTLLEKRPPVILEVDGVAVGLGVGAVTGAAERLKAEVTEGGEAGLGAGGAVKEEFTKVFDEKFDVVAVEEVTGGAKSNKSLEDAGAKCAGREVAGEAGVAFFVKLKSNPLEETGGL